MTCSCTSKATATVVGSILLLATGSRNGPNDKWPQPVSTRKRETIDAEPKKLDKSIGQFLDRVVETDSPTLVKTYESRIRKLEEEKVILRERVASCGRPLKGFDETFRTAIEFLANPCKL